MSRAVAIDIETTGLKWSDRVLSIAASWREGENVKSESINLGMADMFNFPISIPEATAWMQRMIEGADWLVFHNGSFDLPYLLRGGILTDRAVRGKVFDTQLAARFTGGYEYVSLEKLCNHHQIKGADDPLYHKMKKMRAHLERVDPELVLKYAGMDTEKTLRLFEILYKDAQSMYSEEWLRREGNYVLLVSQMRVRGMKLDVPHLEEMTRQKREELKRIEKALFAYGISGPNDHTKLRQLLANKNLTRYLSETAKGNLSVSEDNLLNLPGMRVYLDEFEENKADPDGDGWRKAVALTLRGRELSKQISTWLSGFVGQMDHNERVHPLWGVGGTVSYRLNCTQPNAQAVPKELKIWGADKGYVSVDGDLSQAELRLGAAYAACNKMARIFEEGIDFHYGTSILMYGKEKAKEQRQNAKRANFTGFYGGGVPALQRALGCSEEIARQIVYTWRSTYPEVVRTSKAAEKCWLERGYLVLSHGKRLWATPDDIQRRIYKAFNQLVQGSIAEIVKEAMLRIEEELPEVSIVGQIHDAIKTEMPEEDREVLSKKKQRIIETSTPPHLLLRTNPNIEMKVDIS